LTETDSLETTLAAADAPPGGPISAGRGSAGRAAARADERQEPAADEGYVPVRFQSRITELGMFELWCVSPNAQRRWKLEFSVREAE
jgi:hypothetical protein